MGKTRGPTDKQVERAIGALLRIGVIVAASICRRAESGTCPARPGCARFGAFHGEPAVTAERGGSHRRGAVPSKRALIQLGLLVLIAVPVVRVAVSIVAFALERDWLYVVVTVLVLAILLFSLLGGAR